MVGAKSNLESEYITMLSHHYHISITLSHYYQSYITLISYYFHITITLFLHYRHITFTLLLTCSVGVLRVISCESSSGKISVVVDFAENEWKGYFGEIEKFEAKPLEVTSNVYYWCLINLVIQIFLLALLCYSVLYEVVLYHMFRLVRKFGLVWE